LDTLVQTSEPTLPISKLINECLNIQNQNQNQNQIYQTKQPQTEPFKMFDHSQLKVRIVIHTDHDYKFIIVCDQNVQARICVSYLLYIKQDFVTNFIVDGHKLNRHKYSQFMNEQLKYYTTDPNADKLIRTQKIVDETTEIMKLNIVKLFERGQKLEELEQRTDALNIGAQDFHKDSEKLKCKTCLKHYFCCFASCCMCCT